MLEMIYKIFRPKPKDPLHSDTIPIETNRGTFKTDEMLYQDGAGKQTGKRPIVPEKNPLSEDSIE